MELTHTPFVYSAINKLDIYTHIKIINGRRARAIYILL